MVIVLEPAFGLFGAELGDRRLPQGRMADLVLKGPGQGVEVRWKERARPVGRPKSSLLIQQSVQGADPVAGVAGLVGQEPGPLGLGQQQGRIHLLAEDDGGQVADLG